MNTSVLIQAKNFNSNVKVLTTLWTIPTLLCQYFSGCNEAESLAKFVYPMENVTAERGRDVTFSCVIENLNHNKVAFLKSDPLSLISVEHKIFAPAGRVTKKYRIEYRRDLTKHYWSLIVNDIQFEDGGGYICQVDRDAQMSQIAFLNLKIPPSIDSVRSSHDTYVKERQKVTLTCLATGLPRPKVTWKRWNGQTTTDFLTEDSNDQKFSLANFTIPAVVRSEMGDYVCLADNGVMPSDGWTVQLRVNFAPEIKPIVDHLEVHPGQTIELKCRISGYPRPSISWYLDDKPISPLSEKFPFVKKDEKSNGINDNADILNFNTMIKNAKKSEDRRRRRWKNSGGLEKNEFAYEFMDVLTIENFSERDFGNYSCIADNSLGKAGANIAVSRVATKSTGHAPHARDQRPNMLYEHEDERRDFSMKPALRNINEKTIEAKMLMKSTNGGHSKHWTLIYIYLIIFVDELVRHLY